MKMTDKDRLRKKIAVLRDALSPEERRRRSEQICTHIIRGHLMEELKSVEPGDVVPPGSRDECAGSSMTAAPNHAESPEHSSADRPGHITAEGAVTAQEPVFCTYVPFRSEVDIRPLIEWCRREQVKVAVPRVDAAQRDLQLYVIRSFDDLEPGTWGIPEPKPSVCEPLENLARIRAMLVPGIAFDRSGGRLGYGGGFYDRFLARYIERGLALPPRWAAAFDFQIVEHVPMDPHDIRVGRLITEDGCQRID